MKKILNELNKSLSPEEILYVATMFSNLEENIVALLDSSISNNKKELFLGLLFNESRLSVNPWKVSQKSSLVIDDKLVEYHEKVKLEIK